MLCFFAKLLNSSVVLKVNIYVIRIGGSNEVQEFSPKILGGKKTDKDIIIVNWNEYHYDATDYDNNKGRANEFTNRLN